MHAQDEPTGREEKNLRLNFQKGLNLYVKTNKNVFSMSQ